MEETRHDAAVTTLGFDPGGKGRFGCAALNTVTGQFETSLCGSVDEAVNWACRWKESKVEAAGIDTLLSWQSTKSGWRGADEFLRQTYPACKNSVSAANSLYGAMAVQGAVLAFRIRTLFPSLMLTETHPKVLWHHVTLGHEYPRVEKWKDSVPGVVLDWLNAKSLTGTLNNEDEFDALLSAWAAMQGIKGVWKKDLFLLTAKQQKSDNVSLVSDAHYFWPD